MKRQTTTGTTQEKLNVIGARAMNMELTDKTVSDIRWLIQARAKYLKDLDRDGFDDGVRKYIASCVDTTNDMIKDILAIP